MKIDSFISLFNKVENPTPSGEIRFNDYMEMISTGFWEDPVMNYRSGRAEKKLVPCVTISGTFKAPRSKGTLVEHSGIIAIDLDQKENTHDLIAMRSELYADDYIYGGNISVGGKGLVLYVQIVKEKHLECFLALEKYFADKYELIIDKSCKDVSRLRFVSHDPDAHINLRAKKWTILPSVKEQKLQAVTFIGDDSDIQNIVDQVKMSGVDLAPSYHDWIRLGFALEDKFKESGLEYYLILSQNNPKYTREKAEHQYKCCVNAKGHGITINFLFYLAKQAGLETMSQRTRDIRTTAYLQKKMMNKNGGAGNQIDAKKNAQNYLKEMKGIEPEISSVIIDQVFNFQGGEIKLSKDELLNQQNEYLAGLNIRYNLVTNRPEYKGEPITDRIAAGIYIDMNIIFPGISKYYILDYIQGASEKYNPFLDWFESINHIQSTGNIRKFISSIKGSGSKLMPAKGYSFNDYFIQKWLLSVVSSGHGVYSTLILVLYGDQATGKTKFFRGLLPQEMAKYYTEDLLENGKDSDSILCEHLIVGNDEYGGLNKKDSRRLKDKASKQAFTNRAAYGRFTERRTRYGVLCGTSNDEILISDVTGNRRTIPIHVEKIDFEVYDSIDKTDLWAEIYHLWQKSGDDWMLSPGDIEDLNDATRENTESFSELEWLDECFQEPSEDETTFMSMELICKQIKIRFGQSLRISKPMLGKALQKAGYRSARRKILNVSTNVYFIRDKNNLSYPTNSVDNSNAISHVPTF